jgi:hypothetical protein
VSLPRFARLIIPAAAALALACSDPAAPVPAGDETAALARFVTVPGTYEMAFSSRTGAVVLIGRVRYAGTGLPAQGGEARFYVCKSQGSPAPKAACETGSGHWSPYATSIPIVPSGPEAGNALLLFEGTPSGTTTGFYFRYSGQRTGIANGRSLAADYTAP